MKQKMGEIRCDRCTTQHHEKIWLYDLSWSFVVNGLNGAWIKCKLALYQPFRLVCPFAPESIVVWCVWHLIISPWLASHMLWILISDKGMGSNIDMWHVLAWAANDQILQWRNEVFFHLMLTFEHAMMLCTSWQIWLDPHDFSAVGIQQSFLILWSQHVSKEKTLTRSFSMSQLEPGLKCV